ncbi:MAG: hypothetical protein H0U05_04015, partial [Actinobacteria bacterium]|nr:hypothetical protein [Actinomycetota bacterium]
LRETNEDLATQASLLAQQNVEAEKKNQEIEQSRRALEDKAGQLSVSSKYKSEFIANMSHELRTPLNSLLILAEQLQDNLENTMTETQVEYAGVILASGRDLLGLLNSILDLAKAESGTFSIEMADVPVADLRASLLREFEHVARGKGVGYSVEVDSEVPHSIVTDAQRLGQILKNLLANAFKFTDDGSVDVRIALAYDGWSSATDALVAAPGVVAFSITDTGIGIEANDQQRIFEAFAQGDGTSTRAHGGTGLGLSISRELVGLLGGEVTVASSLGEGSTFTVYIPLGRPAAAAARSATPTAAEPSQGRSTEVVAENLWRHRNPLLGFGRPDLNGLDNRPFEGKKVMVVDDDFRNVFALTALLERGGAEVTGVESGAEALTALEQTPGIDLVLMDS